MEPKAKKPRLETWTEELRFLDMNDDCITLVIEKLDSTDLCSISFVCKRLKGLAYAVHMRKYPNQSITIKPIFELKSGKYKVGFSETGERYLKHMSKAVRNVEFQCTQKGIRDYFKFLKNECCLCLKSLKISQARTNLSLIPGKMIKDQLKNVESLSIETLPVKGIASQHPNWITYCENLKELSITSQFCNGQWMLDEYPHLESLSIHLIKGFDRECFAKYASQFFERHQKLQEIKCVGFNTTQIVLHNVNNIPRLIVKYDWEWNVAANVVKFTDEFRMHRDKGSRIEWLEIDLDHEIGEFDRISEVDAVHPVQGLRSELRGPIGQSTIEILKNLVHLELFVYPVGLIDWIRLSKCLPQLDTLKLSFQHHHRGQKFTFLNVTLPFVRNKKKLKRFDVTVNRSAIIEDDHLLELNSARSLLKNPVHLQMNFKLLGNKCKMIIPTSKILTANVIQTKSTKDESDSSSDEDDSFSDDDDLSADSDLHLDSFSDLNSYSDSDSDSSDSDSDDNLPMFFFS